MEAPRSEQLQARDTNRWKQNTDQQGLEPHDFKKNVFNSMRETGILSNVKVTINFPNVLGDVGAGAIRHGVTSSAFKYYSGPAMHSGPIMTCVDQSFLYLHVSTLSRDVRQCHTTICS